MDKWIEHDQKEMAKRYLRSERHTMQVDYWRYIKTMKDARGQGGCRRSRWSTRSPCWARGEGCRRPVHAALPVDGGCRKGQERRRLGPGGLMRLADVPEPRLPKDGWVRIKPELSGICGSDVGLAHAKSSPDVCLLRRAKAIPDTNWSGWSSRVRVRGAGCARPDHLLRAPRFRALPDLS